MMSWKSTEKKGFTNDACKDHDKKNHKSAL